MQATNLIGAGLVNFCLLTVSPIAADLRLPRLAMV